MLPPKNQTELVYSTSRFWPASIMLFQASWCMSHGEDALCCWLNSVAILIPGDLFTARIRSQLAAKEASFSQELTSDDENELTLQVRMPNGNRNSRRFAKSDKLQVHFLEWVWLTLIKWLTPLHILEAWLERFALQSVFDFIDVGGWVKSDSYSLVS